MRLIRRLPARVAAPSVSSVPVAGRAAPSWRARSVKPRLSRTAVEPLGQLRRQHPLDLGEREAGRRRLGGEPELLGGEQAEHDRDGLVVGEHQRRQLVAGRQPVAAVPAAVGDDRDAELGERGGVPPDGPLVHAEPRAEVGAGQPVVGLEQLQHGQHAGGGM